MLWDLSGRATHKDPPWWSTAVLGSEGQVRSCIFTIRNEKSTSSSYDTLVSFSLTPMVGRHLLRPGHLSVPATGCRLSTRVPDSAADEDAEGLQHSNAGPILLLLQRHSGARPEAGPAASQSVSFSLRSLQVCYHHRLQIKMSDMKLPRSEPEVS